jgi:hypothetical protein
MHFAGQLASISTALKWRARDLLPVREFAGNLTR